VDPVWIGIFVIWVLAPAPAIIVALIERRTRARERAEDIARQDQVARKADETASLLQASQRLTIEKADEVAAVAAQVARSVAAATKADVSETHAQLKQIHTLVNSDMTAARQGELNQARLTLVMLRRIVALTEAAGRDITSAELSEIERTEQRIAELEAIIADRMTQFRLAEAEIQKP
jgi:hypothetical protein